MAQPPIAPPPGLNGPPGLDRPQDLDLKTIQQLGTKILAKSNEVTPSDDKKNNNATVVSEDSGEKKEKLENASKNQNDRSNNKRRGRGNNQPRNQGDRHASNAHSNGDEPKTHQKNQGRGRGQQHSQRGEHSAQRGRGSNNSTQSANAPAAGKKLKNISDFNSRSDDKAAEKKDEPRAEVNTKTSGDVLADDVDAVYCLTCCEPIAYFALGACNHRDLCDKCSLRMRECYKDNSCPLCKNAIDQVIYTRDENKKYEEYEVKQMWYDDLLKAYFEDEAHYTKTLTLWDFVCPVCRDQKSKFNGLFALQKHIKTAHQLYYCDVCLKYRKVFLHEQKLYNKVDLPKHKREGDSELKLKPHSWCEYCKQYLFGEDELFYHCQDKHETCFLCEAKGIRWQYFRNYDHLERHFDARHQLCHDEQCLARKFVVFDSPIELQAHRISVHGKQMSKQELLQAKTLQVNWNASSNTNQNAASSEEGYVMHLKFDVGGTVAQSPNAIKSALASNESPNTSNNNNSNNGGSAGLSRDEIAKRNKAVISAMKAYLGNEAKFTQFRNVSAQFRQRQLSTEHYWQEFISIFGKDPTGLDLFEALTELLPDNDADLRATLLTLVAAARLEQGPARVDSRHFPSLAGSARDGQSVSLSANYSTLLRPSAPPSRDEFPALAPSRGASSGGTRGPALHQHQYFQQHPSLLPNFYAPRNSDAQHGQNSAASVVNNNPAPANQAQGGKKKKKQVQVLSWG